MKYPIKLLRKFILVILFFHILFFQNNSYASISSLFKKAFPEQKKEFKKNQNQETSPYWSNTVDGPTTIDSAKKYLKVNGNLDPIEGIWFEDNLGYVLIYKDPKNKSQFKLYIIQIDDEKLNQFNGTLEATIFKKNNKYLFQNRIWYSTANGGIAYYGTQGGIIEFIDSVTILKDYEKKSDAGVDMDSQLELIWPKKI